MAYVVRCRGFPYDINEEDMANWFEPLIPVSIDLNNNSMEAYVTFENEEDANQAVKEYHRKDMGRRYVEVFHSSEEEYSKFLSQSMGLDLDGVLKLRGLPFNCTADHVLEWLSNWEIELEDVAMIFHTGGNRAGQPTGEAIVKFRSQEEAQDCKSTKHKTSLEVAGKERYIELFPATLVMWQNAGETQHDPSQEDRPKIRLRGLPFTAKVSDIVDFFHEHGFENVRERDTFLLPGKSSNRPSGEATVALGDEVEMRRAVADLHKKHMGSRYIEVYPNSNFEGYDRRQTDRDRDSGGGRGGGGYDRGGGGYDRGGPSFGDRRGGGGRDYRDNRDPPRFGDYGGRGGGGGGGGRDRGYGPSRGGRSPPRGDRYNPYGGGGGGGGKGSNSADPSLAQAAELANAIQVVNQFANQGKTGGMDVSAILAAAAALNSMDGSGGGGDSKGKGKGGDKGGKGGLASMLSGWKW